MGRGRDSAGRASGRARARMEGHWAKRPAEAKPAAAKLPLGISGTYTVNDLRRDRVAFGVKGYENERKTPNERLRATHEYLTSEINRDQKRLSELTRTRTQGPRSPGRTNAAPWASERSLDGAIRSNTRERAYVAVIHNYRQEGKKLPAY